MLRIKEIKITEIRRILFCWRRSGDLDCLPRLFHPVYVMVSKAPPTPIAAKYVTDSISKIEKPSITCFFTIREKGLLSPLSL
jgi:hypothetical protein